MSDTDLPVTIDVRPIPPRERHPRIFGLYASLEPGKHFFLVNDHDPKPLWYQFQAEHGDRVEWQYLESGPDVWKVQIGKRAAQ